MAGKWFLVFAALVGVVVLSASSTDDLVAEGASLQQAATGFGFTEGPARDAEGNVYFTDRWNNSILKWSEDGSVEEVTADAGRANGLYFDPEGNLLACADLDNELRRISPDGEVEVLVGRVDGRRLNGPNDVWVAPRGGIYFTDPFYRRKYWKHEDQEIEVEGVYYLSPDGELGLVADDLVKPNGIVGTADGSALYIADGGDEKTYRYEIQADGSLANRTLLAPMGSDGMTLDERGNVYLTGDGVTVFSSDGKQLRHIAVPEKATTNVTFGGKDRRTLFVTASRSIYTLDMQVAGQ